MKNSGENDETKVLEPVRKPRGKPSRTVPNVRSVSLLGVGMVIGAVVGAGVTLLMAPRTGREMRALLGDRAGRVRSGGGGVWYKLGKELRKAAAAKRKLLEREEARQRVKHHSAAQPAETV